MTDVNALVRTYKSNKNMTEIERKEHIKQLNRARRNRAYRKKKLEQFLLKQQQSPKFKLQKVNLDEEEEDNVYSDEEDIICLSNLYEYIGEQPEDKSVLEAIDILEDKLEIDEDKKLNYNKIFNSDNDSSCEDEINSDDFDTDNFDDDDFDNDDNDK